MSNVITVEAKFTGDAASMVHAANQSSAALDKVTGGSNKLANFLPNLGHKVISVAKEVVKFGIELAAAGVAMATAFAGEAIKAGIEHLKNVQDITQSLTKSLGSASKAGNLVAQTMKVIKGTPFDFAAFGEGAKQLVQFGFSAQKIPRMLKDIGDAAAASGKGEAGVSALVTIFGRMNVMGKLTNRTLVQLSQNGVQGQKILANGLGVSTTKLQQMISKGLVPADKATTILMNGIEHGSKGAAGAVAALAGSAQGLMKTWSGATSALKVAFADMGAAWVGSFQRTVPQIISTGVIPLLHSIGEDGKLMFDKLNQGAIIKNVTNFLGNIAKFLNPASNSFAALIKNLSPLHLIVDALKDAWPKLKQPLMDVSSIVIHQLLPAAVNLVAAFIPAIPLIGQLADAFARGLAGAVPAATAVLTTFIQVITPLITAVSALPTPVLALATALIGLQSAGFNITGTLTSMGGAFVSIISGIDAAGNKIPSFTAALGSIKTAASSGGVMGALSGLGSFITGPWGMAIGGAIAILGTLALSAMPQAAKNTDALAASFDRLSGSMTQATRDSVINELQTSGAFRDAAKYGISASQLVDASLNTTKGQKAAHQAVVKKITSTYVNPSAKQQQNFGAGANVLNEVGGQNTAINNAKDLAKNYLAANNQTVKSEGALGESFKKATAAIKENGKTLNTTTLGGKANATAVAELSKKYQALVVVEANQHASAATIHANQLSAVHDAMGLATQLGLTGQKAIEFTAKMLKIPVKKVTTLSLEDAAANKKLAYVKAQYDSLHNKSLSINLNAANAMAKINAYKKAVAGLASVNGHISYGGPGAAIGGMWEGGHRYMAGGGFSGARTSMMATGGSNITWAEKSTGWESYISGDKSMAQRSASIWAATGKRLGLLGHSGGGEGGVMELGPQAMKLLRILAGKDTSVSIGDETISASAGRGTKKSVLSGRG